MTDENTYGREVVQILEIRQPWCVNTYGTAPCTASGTPKCFQAYWTCGDTANYDPSGFIYWRFSRPQDNIGPLYEQDSDREIYTNAIPLLVSASTTSSSINLGSSRDGESPLGTRASLSCVMSDAIWDDHVGDPYKGDRTSRQDAGFWKLWTARNPFYPNMTAVLYTGYKGQALSAMQQRLYDLSNVEGPNGSGQYTITGKDPLDKARSKKAKFPPTLDMTLAADITSSTTSIPLTCIDTDLTQAYGNTGKTKYIGIGSEIIRYRGYTGTAPDLTLTGVARGQLGTTADSHAAEDAVERVGRYEHMRPYSIAEDLLENHTEVKNTYVNTSLQWDTEGGSYLSTIYATATIASGTPVFDLLGELCRDGMFSIWWDERLQRIPMIAQRPPTGTPAKWTSENNEISGQFSKVAKPDDRLTRISTFYRQRDPTESLDDKYNYEYRRILSDAEVESDNATGGQIIEKSIYSRWLQDETSVLLAQAALRLRYRLPPNYITIGLDAKDRASQIGDVIDLTTRHIVDTEGVPLETRWQIIGIDEVAPGSAISAKLQSYTFVGKFAIIMADSAPDYATATDAEKLEGCWLADDVTGLMPDGSDPYLLQ